MPTRRTYLSVNFNGTVLPHTFSASCRYGWRLNAPEATVFVPRDPFPGSQPYDQPVTIDMGAGNNITRFRGLFRRYDFSLLPRQLGLVFNGYMVRALEFENNQSPVPDLRGLDLLNLTGSATPTDADVVKAVLTAAGVSYTAANIGGTGVTWASRSLANYSSYTWTAGISPSVLVGYAGVGQKALSYIQQWDAVSAVYTSSIAPVGFYRTYETVNGIYRALIGGRPRGTIDVPAFSEGIDIAPGAQSSRAYPLANAAYVTGADFGFTGANPVRNVNGTTFVGQSSNPFQPTTKSITYQFSSRFIEWALEADGGIGMNCERVGNALLADLNRETVSVRFRTWRDDLILPGYTILVQGPGGQPDRLGIGEKLWVDEVTTGVGPDGAFYQDITATGGGSPDTATPPPPG